MLQYDVILRCCRGEKSLYSNILYSTQYTLLYSTLL